LARFGVLGLAGECWVVASGGQRLAADARGEHGQPFLEHEDELLERPGW
jgi:hypothetical protein